jgi:DNA adenine methylase
MTEPFLKWAGSKRRLLPALRRFYPTHFSSYYEPFLGGGAVFFDIKPAGVVHLSDANPDLIATYVAIRDEPEMVIRQLQTLPVTPTKYDEIRNTPGMPFRLTAEQNRIWTAVRFLYINRVGFNGLWRLNKSGQVNTPYGKPDFTHVTDQLPPDRIRACSKALQGVHVKAQPWTKSLSEPFIGPDSFVYVDPPYDGAFTGYTAAGFTSADQTRLRERLDVIRKTGATVVASNSDTPFIRDLYKDWHVYKVDVHRSIAGGSKGRGTITELIISSSPRTINGVVE